MRISLLYPGFPQILLPLLLMLIFIPACSAESDETPPLTSGSQSAAESPTPIKTVVVLAQTTTALPTDAATIEPTSTPSDTPIPEPPTATATPVRISVTSPAFETGDLVPERYARSGDNLSIPLEWSDPPARTESFVILFVGEPVSDGGGTWILWAAYNLAADLRGLPEGVTTNDEGQLDFGGQHLENSYLELAYSGPPTHPIESRRFYMRVYALDTMLSTEDIEEASAAVDSWIGGTELILLKAMSGHILAEGQLSGKYKGESPVG